MINGSVEKIGRVHYLVTDSERDQNEVAAALGMHVHGYDWLSSGSNSEYVWDDESDESDGGRRPGGPSQPHLVLP